MSPIAEALTGGILIGIASALPLWWHGRIAGASGLMAETLKSSSKEKLSGISFLIGLVFGAFILSLIKVNNSTPLTLNPLLITGALLVGIGARLGGGCTSGHGICGLARLSKRSIIATVVFLGTAILTANLVRYLK